MTHEEYLHQTMEGLSNLLANVSQQPTEQSLHHALNSIKATLEIYNRVTSRAVRIYDAREWRE